MIISVSRSPLEDPLLVTDKATWLDIRDDQGFLIFICIFPPGGAAFLTVNRTDNDFEDTARNFSIPLHVDPSTLVK